MIPPLLAYRIAAGSAALVAALLLHGCAQKTAPPLPVVPSGACDFRMIDLNRRLCAEQGGTLVITPHFTHPCGACNLP